MQQRHKNRFQYFNEQKESTKKYVLPYIQKHFSLLPGSRVLEVGCGEGGNLYPFLEMGCECYGVELSEFNYNNALHFYAENPLKEHLHFLHKNIYDVEPEDIGGTFDVVFLRDVIEHIPNQEMFMRHLKKFAQNTTKL
jgi:2-polyprenyl-3-methyl-5-hydroxy-6-metoxy-1,4-benzoquinol methylase